MRAVLGNPAPVETHHSDVAEERGLTGDTTRLPGFVRVDKSDELGETDTEFLFPEGHTVIDAVNDVRAAWAYHGDNSPSYVASDSDLLAQLLADHFGAPVRPLA